MTMSEVTLKADEKGIWRSDNGGKPFGIEWEEIYGISGYTMSYSNGPEIEIEFDFDYGESFRINETWEGFNDIIKAVHDRKMYREESWLQKVSAVGEDDEIYEIWQKS